MTPHADAGADIRRAAREIPKRWRRRIRHRAHSSRAFDQVVHLIDAPVPAESVMLHLPGLKLTGELDKIAPRPRAT